MNKKDRVDNINRLYSNHKTYLYLEELLFLRQLIKHIEEDVSQRRPTDNEFEEPRNGSKDSEYYKRETPYY